MLPYNDFAANGNNPLNSVSQLKGALQSCWYSFWSEVQCRFAEIRERHLDFVILQYFD